jgi:hypothetical protein
MAPRVRTSVSSDDVRMSPLPLVVAVLLPVLGMVVLAAALAVRTSGQCRHRVAHARVIARARRIEEMRRQQFMNRLQQGGGPSFPRLATETVERR